MALTFTDTHNMIAFLSKSDASEGFNQIIDFLNASSIKYALTVNPNIYMSIIKQFWSSVAVKKVNDVSRLQALVNSKKVIITKATIRDALHLDDAEGIECLPNEEIFTELARIGRHRGMSLVPLWLQLSYAFPHVENLIFLRLEKGVLLFEGMIVAQQVGEGAAEVNVEDVLAADVTDEGAASVNDDDVPVAVDEPSIPSPTPSTQPPPTSQDIPSTLQGRMIADMDENMDVTLKDIAKDVAFDTEIEESADVLSMQDDEVEPAKLQKVVEVVTTSKLITKVVIAASAIIIAIAQQLTTAAAPTLTTAPSAARRRKGVVIKDPEETATPSTIIHAEAKSKDKGKGILLEEPKPLKKQAQIEQDEAYDRELEAELNKNIDWDEVIDHVQRKEKEDNAIKRYQAFKRKPQTEAQAMKNMMIYLRNVVGFKMDYFKGMTYDDIHPIFKRKFNSNVAFLQKTKEQMEEEDNRALKRLSESQEDKAAKKKKLDKEVEELRKNLQIVPNDDDDVYTEATPLALKDVDEQPVQDLALNVDNVFQANDCDAFDYDVDEAPTTQTMFRENLSSTNSVYDEVSPSYDSNILFEVPDRDNYQDADCEHHEQVQPALYNGHEILKTNHFSAIVHNSEDTLEIAKITRKKMNEKMKDPECVEKKVKIAPHAYSKENYLATFTPHKQLTPEQIFWSKDLLKMKAEALKEQTTTSRPIKVLTVYPSNTPATLVPRKHSDADPIHDLKALDSQNKELHAKVNALHDLNERWRAKNEKVKRHYKELYDSIKITRAKTINKTNSLLTEVTNLNAQITKNYKSNFVTMPNVKSKVLPPGMYVIDVEPIPPRMRNNREVHLDYLKHLKKSVATFFEIVEEARVEKPLDSSLASTCLYTKHSQKKRVTFMDPCEASTNNTLTHVKQQTMNKTNEPVILSTGVKGATAASRSKPKSNTKKDRTLPAKSDMKKVEVHSRNNKSNVKKRIMLILVIAISVKQVWQATGKLFATVGCSKHMMGDRSRLRNFVKKFIRTVRFMNDYFSAIMGYGNYVIGDSVISKVYYAEGLGHNLFSVRQFCDSDLEVTFRKHSCYVYDMDGVELIKGSHGSNLNTILVEDMMKSSSICLLSKASKNKSWLWHRRSNHLNFGTINDLAKKDLVRGLPRLKFEKDHLCSACQLGKSKKHTHTPKTENTNLEVLNTLHIDLCGSMRVQTINGKKYILVIVDDYL
nr:retrovirus-related Pol polyprotein from transposon TNT 1-94 [Tanacetum cinerariifolium]